VSTSKEKLIPIFDSASWRTDDFSGYEQTCDAIEHGQIDSGAVSKSKDTCILFGEFLSRTGGEMGFEQLPISDTYCGLLSYDANGHERLETTGLMSSRVIEKAVEHPAVLSGGPVYLAKVVESPHTRTWADVGKV